MRTLKPTYIAASLGGAADSQPSRLRLESIAAGGRFSSVSAAMSRPKSTEAVPIGRTSPARLRLLRGERGRAVVGRVNAKGDVVHEEGHLRRELVVDGLGAHVARDLHRRLDPDGEGGRERAGRRVIVRPGLPRPPRS